MELLSMLHAKIKVCVKLMSKLKKAFINDNKKQIKKNLPASHPVRACTPVTVCRQSPAGPTVCLGGQRLCPGGSGAGPADGWGSVCPQHPAPDSGSGP